MTNVVFNRFHPDPLGIVLWRYKSEFVEERLGIEQHCHSEPVCGLVRNDREFDKFQFVNLLIDPDKQEIKAAIQ